MFQINNKNVQYVIKSPIIKPFKCHISFFKQSQIQTLKL